MREKNQRPIALIFSYMRMFRYKKHYAVNNFMHDGPRQSELRDEKRWRQILRIAVTSAMYR